MIERSQADAGVQKQLVQELPVAKPLRRKSPNVNSDPGRARPGSAQDGAAADLTPSPLGDSEDTNLAILSRKVRRKIVGHDSYSLLKDKLADVLCTLTNANGRCSNCASA